MDPELASLWKEVGRETDAGKMLYDLYNHKGDTKSKISYPEIKGKHPAQIRRMKEEAKKKIQKKCPQRAHVDVPVPSNGRKGRKWHQIDFVPKRKTQTQISSQMDTEYKRHAPAQKKGFNRDEMINDLQTKFQYGNDANAILGGGMMKKVAPSAAEVEAKLRKTKAPKIKKQTFQVPDFAKEKYGDITDVAPLREKSTKNHEDAELAELFDKVALEIEDRQKHIEEMAKMGADEKIIQRTKTEIVSRISELQKIRQLQNA